MMTAKIITLVIFCYCIPVVIVGRTLCDCDLEGIPEWGLALVMAFAPLMLFLFFIEKIGEVFYDR